MKRFGLLVLFLLALAAPAFAQVGDISVYADDQGNSCNITDPGGFLAANVYVVHKFKPSEQSTGVRFKVSAPAGANWVFVAFSTQFTPNGSVGTDLTIGYGQCQSATTLVGSIIINSVTPSPACGYVSIAPNDFTNAVVGTDCSFGEFPLTYGQGIVNGNVSCPCNIATEPTTWGKVKSLYR